MRLASEENPVSAWAGATVITNSKTVRKSVTQERWIKAQTKIRWLGFQAGLWDEVSDKLMDKDALKMERQKVPAPDVLDYKTAVSFRGFLVYVARTYSALVPYLKGLHLTIDSWRPNRDEEGWRYVTPIKDKVDLPNITSPPGWVKMVPRFVEDMRVLMDFTKGEHPPSVPVRPSSCYAT